MNYLSADMKNTIKCKAILIRKNKIKIVINYIKRTYNDILIIYTK